MNRTKLPAWIAAALLIPALLSLYSVYKRHQVESLNKATALAVEIDTLESLAAAQGMTVETAIEQLKPQGLNTIVLSEETIGELLTQGRATLVPKSTPQVGTKPEFSLHFTGTDEVRSRVWRGLEIRLHELVVPPPPRSGRGTSDEGSDLPLPAVSMNVIRSTSIGLNPDDVDIAKKAGLSIVARCSNPSGVSSRSVQETLNWAKQLGATIFLASGDQVLGRKDAIATTAEALKSLGMLYATPEFTKIGGDADILRKTPENIVRLHSAQVAELDKLSLADAVERYSKASRERNMRVLLIRPVSYAADRPVTAFGGFLGMIRDQIVHDGGAVGTPKPFTEPNLPKWLPILLGISAMPAVWFAFGAFVSGRRAQTIAAAILALLGVSCATHMGLHLTALLASIAFPTLGFVILDRMRPRNVLVGFLVVTAISLLGGLVVAGMLNGLRYYVTADAFTGVKLSIAAPILLVGIYFALRLTNVKETLKNPILWGTALLGLVLAVVFLVMVARTGNDSDVGASPIEMVFRNYLDRILFVRPRTKEFLIGHPLLFVGVGLLGYISRSPKRLNRFGGWAALILMVGAMGQSDIVNTLTHLHIPVALSLARIGIGVVFGSIIGLGLWAIVSRLLPKGEEEA